MTNSEIIINALKENKKVWLKKDNDIIALLNEDFLKGGNYNNIYNNSICSKGITILFNSFEIE